MSRPAYQRGLILFQQRRYSLAIEEFHRDLAESPDNSETLAMLALSLAHAGEYEGGEQAARNAIAADPGFAFAHYALCTVILLRPVRHQALLLRLIRNNYRLWLTEQLKRAKTPTKKPFVSIRTMPITIGNWPRLSTNCTIF